MSLMARRFWIVAIIVFVVSSVFAQPLRTLDASVERKIDSLLSLMTLEEKLGQLNQLTGQWDEKLKRQVLTDEERDLVKKGRIGSYLNVVGADVTRDFQRVAVEESRLHIPLLFGLDVIHGFRTIFPVPLAEACTWDPALVERSARVAAIEATAAGVHWTFAPMVDIARDPRWGRIMEGSGEDPYLGAAMAAARVRGFQGRDLSDPTSLLACAKHFAGYGGAEGGRDYNIAQISARTMHEVYLAPFKAAVDAGVGSFMSAFNEINGVPATAARFLMTDVLRNEWGFKGFVVSDWGAVEELMNHGVAATREEAGRLALNAGVDMEMVSRIYEKDLPAAVREKRLSEAVVDESVRRVLRAKFKLGLFDNPYRNCDTSLAKRVTLTKEHRDLARRAAQKAIVLLKNEKNLLPLGKEIKRVAVLGPLAADTFHPLGGWNAQGSKDDVVSVFDGIARKVSPRTKVLYHRGCEIEGDSGYNAQAAVKIVRQADAAIVVVGEGLDMSGEAASRSNLDLPGKQREFVKAIVATGKPVVLVLMNGRPLTIPWAAENVDAIVEAWFLGVQSGNAIADVLFGDVSPSGKLPVSFLRTVGQIPIYYNHKNTGRPFNEKEKYTSKYLDVPNTPLFPFGFGLSYTTFAYSNLRVASPTISSTQELEVVVDVTNTGNRSADEIVQLYIQDEVASITRPVKELKGFQRIALNAGEKRTVQFMLKPEQLAFWNQEMKFAVEPGMFKVFVGGNSVEVLEARFELK